MEKIKNEIRNKIHDKKLYFFAIVTALFFGIFCIMQYAPDTYTVFTDDIDNRITHFCSCGRFVSGLYLYFVRKVFDIGNRGTYFISYFMAIICMSISLYKLYNIIRSDISNNTVISVLTTIMIIINPFSIELFLYIEKGIIILSILLCILAIEQIIKYFKEKSKIAIFWGIVFMTISNCCYQGTVGLFFGISLIYIIKYSKNISEFIKNNVIVVIEYGIPAIINFLIIKFMAINSRVSGNIIFSDSIKKIIDGTKSMLFYSYGILPKFYFITMIIILLVFIIYKSFIQKSSIKEKILNILGIIYIILGLLAVTIMPQLLQDTNSIWFVARSSYPMGAILGIMLLYILLNIDLKKLDKLFLIAIIIIFLSIQFCSFMRFSIDNYIGNYMDKTITLNIESIIEEYELKTGEKVDSIAIYRDSVRQYTYPELKMSGDMNIKAYSADWCIPGIIKLYTNRNLKIVESREDLNEKFLQKNWDYFDREQIVFDHNVMHICIF